MRRPCAKDGWQNGGISFYYAWVPRLPSTLRRTPLSIFEKRDIRPRGDIVESLPGSLIVDLTNHSLLDVCFSFSLSFLEKRNVREKVLSLGEYCRYVIPVNIWCLKRKAEVLLFSLSFSLFHVKKLNKSNIFVCKSTSTLPFIFDTGSFV